MPEVLLAKNLEKLPGLRHGFYTRAWGNCGRSEEFEEPDYVANRARIAEHLGVAPANLLNVFQMHLPVVVTVTKIWSLRERPFADGMVTKMEGVGLGILNADCGQLLLADMKAGVIGAIHVSVQCTAAGIIEKALAAMESLGAGRANIHAALGPCIAVWEIGPKMRAAVLAQNAEYEKWIEPASGRNQYIFNQLGYIGDKLHAAGIASLEPPPCTDTCADEARFFSLRRNEMRGLPPNERTISAIALAE